MGRDQTIRYPRRRAARWVLRTLAGRLIRGLGHLRIDGLEHVPAEGPVILAANHFDFTDAPLLLYASPRMVEFIGGAQRPNSPSWAQAIPKAWGFIRAYRGGFSRSTLAQSLDVLSQDGVLGVFPEGGNWAQVLRPARPGMSYLAHKARAPIVPVSIAGATELLGGPRKPVSVSFHPPIAAPEIDARGRARRLALDAFSREVMATIASGLPIDRQGEFSPDPDARAAALAVSDFPFDAPGMRGM